MNLSATAQATLLLTSYFSKASSEGVKPLSNTEWGRFALWLKSRSTTPADLLDPNANSLLNDWNDSRVSAERILQLLSRGHSLALAVEKWHRAGLWVVTRSDPEYPIRLKHRLKNNSPPVLFGCGEKAKLNVGGLAVIGSRSANKADLSYTMQVGASAAAEGIAIVSGGARGVDETAMLGAMNQGGSVIGIMANNLLQAATSTKWRNGLMDGYIVLLSPFYPEAGFNAGNAMARNKYIYCLADSSLVIHSGKKGGTLNGAQENLKKHWVPLWVKPTTDSEAANADLVAKGGRWCEADINDLKVAELITTEAISALQVKDVQVDLFTTPASVVENVVTNGNKNDTTILVEGLSLESEVRIERTESVDFYQLFLNELTQLAASPVTHDFLVEKTGLHKSQLNEWLKRATSEGMLMKLTRPVRYQVKSI